MMLPSQSLIKNTVQNPVSIVDFGAGPASLRVSMVSDPTHAYPRCDFQ